MDIAASLLYDIGEVDLMTYPVRLKTGFFETTAYTLSVLPDVLILSPKDGSRNVIQIVRIDADLFTLTVKKHFVFEILTRKCTLTGIFVEGIDRKELERDLRGSLGGRFVTEK
jgi:hypothetical protein